MAGNRGRQTARQKAVQEIGQRSPSGDRRRGNTIGHPVVPHATGAAAHHLLFLFRFFAVIGQETAFKALYGRCREQFRAHGITGMGRGGGIQAEGFGLLLQGLYTLHHRATFVRLRPEYLQERAGVKRVFRLQGKGIVAVGDIGHGRHTLFPELVHGVFQAGKLCFQGRSVAQGVDLVDKAGHARSLAEESLHVGQFHMAMSVYKARNDGPVQKLLPFLTRAETQDGAVVVHLHKCIAEGLTGLERIQVFGRKTLHSESLTLTKSIESWGTCSRESQGVTTRRESSPKRRGRVSTGRTRGSGRWLVSGWVL